MPTFLQRSLFFVGQHRRWSIVALLYLFSTVSNLDRQALAVLAPVLKDKLHFGPIEYSYIVSAFLVAYALGYAFCGRIIDRIGVKLALGAALAAWTVAGMLHALAIGWVSLAIFRFPLGLAESFNVPAGIKAITEWVPPKERGICIALFSNGHVLGAMLAPPIVALIAWHFGWRCSLVISSGVGLLLLALWWAYYDSPEKHPGLSETERTLILSPRGPIDEAVISPRPSLKQVLFNPACMGLFLAQFLTDPIAFFLSFWLPDFLHTRGLTLVMIGLVSWLPYLGADLGGPGGGALSDWLVRRKWTPLHARRTLMLAAACLMLLANFVVRTPLMEMSILLLGCLFVAQSCWKANLLTLTAESVPREHMATLVAICSLGGSVGGILANLAAGRVIATYGYGPVFTALSFVPLTAFGLLELSLYLARRQRIRSIAA